MNKRRGGGARRFEAPLPDALPDEQAAMAYAPAGPPAGRSKLERARARHESALLQIDGVVGVGVGQTPVGDPAIVVYVREASVRKRVAKAIDGFPVQVVVSGEFHALPAT